MAEFKPKGGGQLPGSMMDVASRAPGGGGGGGKSRSGYPKVSRVIDEITADNNLPLADVTRAVMGRYSPEQLSRLESQLSNVPTRAIRTYTTGDQAKFEGIKKKYGITDDIDKFIQDVFEGGFKRGGRVQQDSDSDSANRARRLDKPLRKARGG